MPPGRDGAPCRSGSSGAFFVDSPTPTENTSRGRYLVVGQFAVGEAGIIGGSGWDGSVSIAAGGKRSERYISTPQFIPPDSRPCMARAGRLGRSCLRLGLVTPEMERRRWRLKSFKNGRGSRAEQCECRDRSPPRAGVGLIYPAFANPEKWRASARIKAVDAAEPSAPARGEASDEFLLSPNRRRRAFISL